LTIDLTIDGLIDIAIENGKIISAQGATEYLSIPSNQRLILPNSQQICLVPTFSPPSEQHQHTWTANSLDVNGLCCPLKADPEAGWDNQLVTATAILIVGFAHVPTKNRHISESRSSIISDFS
jgi:hypothetical protein